MKTNNKPAYLFFVLWMICSGQAVHAALYSFNGDDAGDRFGWSVSNAGDVNGDGYPDMIVGAPEDDNNATNSGSARVFSGLDGSTLYTFRGDNAGDYFGFSVSGAGDVNGDGYADVIVGAYYDDNNDKVNSGSATIFSGIDGSILYVFNGDNAGDEFGRSVNDVGDINKDGYADVIVGAMKNDYAGTDAGRVKVFSGMSGAVLYSFTGNSAGDQFGASVSGAGDVNGDGYPDVIIGANMDGSNGVESGSAYVFSGQNGSALFTFYGDSAFDSFGYPVSSAGDVNGDGYADVMVGAYFDDHAANTNAGSVRVLSGKTGSVLYTFYGDKPSVYFGGALGNAGDVNADGYADIIAGADWYASNGTASGIARVLSGKDGSTLYTFNGDAANDHFGFSVSGAGDVNRDGFDDLVIGAYLDDDNGVDSGTVKVFSGVTNADYWDTDNDGLTDAAEIAAGTNRRLADTDGDGINDNTDAFPLDPSETLDTDGDGIGNNADTDDDNDGYADIHDAYPLNPYKWKFPSCDFDGDSDSDILVRDLVTNLWKIFKVQSAVVTSNVTIGIPDDVYTQHMAVLDSDGDGDKDILTRNSNTGLWTLYEVDNGNTIAAHSLLLYASANWKLVATGDFNGDAVDDVLLRDSVGGSYRTFLLGHHGVAQVKYFNGWLSAESEDQGVGDFDGDGTDDLLVRRRSDNLYFIFRVLNGDVASRTCVCNLWKNPDWTFQFASDLNADGMSDIVIRGTGPSADGKWWRFQMNNLLATNTAYLNLYYHKEKVKLGAVGDYNGDGTNDVMVRVDDATTYVAPIANGLVTGHSRIGNFGAGQAIEH